MMSLGLRQAARQLRLAPAALSLGGGALLSLALAPWHMLFGVPVALAAAGWLAVQAASARAAALAGWLFGLGYFAFGLSWIIEPFQIDPDRHAWMAPFALVFLAAGLALFWGGAFGIAARVSRGAVRVPVLIALWALAEFARAYLLTGFPWAAFGQFWIDTPAASLLPLIGPQGLALLTLVAFLPLGLLRKNAAAAVLPLAAVAAAVVTAPAPSETELTKKTVRIVQPNAPQNLKWHPDHRWEFVRRALAFSAEDPRPDLIVWPETAVPQLLNYAGDTLQVVAEGADSVPVLLGIQREEGGAYFNSAVLLDADGLPAATYDKAHLVPFGEYVPFGDFMARFGIHGFASQAGAGYAAGPGAEVMELPIGSALPLICYEAVFPQDVNAAKTRPDMLVQVTNDAWFGTRSGPYQHLVQARMRALEQGLPMIRAANTGVSAMIAPDGTLLDRLPLGEAGYIDAALPAPLPPTLYRRTGDWPVFLLCLFIAGAAIFLPRALAPRS
ncbi:apolipoprotein N-acyltransferase [Leisingera daeponensis]|uniref:Apolipoprotein N-acyltransferase n=1 Tax=Leisingera daeponensis TaxID=405746 RepID=A0ABS7NIQ9_9RHOB|nr:apolipoprotein N-acyltransferase [Leisingera daeponensis]MBY6141050.1 apolipoprotein N-acyltransferase [Leisingera daeponensis]